MRAISLLCAFAFLSAAMCLPSNAQAVPEPAKPPAEADPLPEKDGLKISISPTYLRDDERNIELRPGDPHINVVLQNTSSKPINIFEEWNSSGYGNLTLKIAKVDGKVLDEPLIVSKGVMAWSIDSTFAEALAPGQARVREVRLQIPVQILYPTSPVKGFLNPNGPFYGEFPLPSKGASRQITLSAVFSNQNANSETRLKKKVVVWTGRIASPPTDYCIFWGADPR